MQQIKEMNKQVVVELRAIGGESAAISTFYFN
jgi:hypothetical protein